MIRSLLNPPQTLTADAADALAVALCLAHSRPWQVSLGSLATHRSFSRSRRTTSAKKWALGDGL
jgi:hypothetical protein